MSNIHTLNYDQNNESPNNPQNPYHGNANQNNTNNGNRQSRRNFGGGQSLDGQHTGANPWANQNVQPAHNANDEEESWRGPISTVRTQPGENGAQAEDDEPELNRHLHGHVFDPFWTDNFLPDEPPGYGEIMIASCGCGCCLGPCCSDVRKDDWKRFFLSFTVWAIIVEFIMLIIEYAIDWAGIDWSALEPSFAALVNLGAKSYPLIYCRYQVFRYVTPIVLHAGLFHYGFNTLFTYRVMLPREVYWGVLRTAVMYIVSGIGGSIVSLALYPGSISVGASGALCGVFGGYIVDVIRMWPKMSSRLKMSHGFNIAIYFISMIIMGFIPALGVDNGAHLGGLLTGFFLGMIILQKKLAFRILGGALLLVSWALPTALLFSLKIPDCSLW